MSSGFAAPAFYSVPEFADMLGLSEGHIRHAARAFVNPDATTRAKLPDGYGAFKWSGIYIVYDLNDSAVIARMFNVTL